MREVMANATSVDESDGTLVDRIRLAAVERFGGQFVAICMLEPENGGNYIYTAVLDDNIQCGVRFEEPHSGGHACVAFKVYDTAK